MKRESEIRPARYGGIEDATRPDGEEYRWNHPSPTKTGHRLPLGVEDPGSAREETVRFFEGYRPYIRTDAESVHPAGNDFD